MGLNLVSSSGRVESRGQIPVKNLDPESDVGIRNRGRVRSGIGVGSRVESGWERVSDWVRMLGSDLESSVKVRSWFKIWIPSRMSGISSRVGITLWVGSWDHVQI